MRAGRRWISRGQVQQAAADAVALLKQGDAAAAADLLTEVLQRAKPELGPRDRDVLPLRLYHAEALLAAGQAQTAQKEFPQLIRDLARTREYGPDHQLTQRAKQGIDRARRALGETTCLRPGVSPSLLESQVDSPDGEPVSHERQRRVHRQDGMPGRRT